MNRITTNVDQKLVRDTKFPPEFSQKVDTSKINIQIIKNWAKGEVARILNNEDDIVEGLLFGLIETKNPDIKSLQIQLTGFLGKDAAPFCKELWNLLLDAQKATTGVPQQLLEAKMNELQQERAERAKAAEAAQRVRDEERARDREMDEIRYRDRSDRGHGRRGGYRDGRDNDRRGGHRGDRDYDRGPRRSRSPSPRFRRGSDEYGRRPPPSRETDSYVPSAGNRARGGGRGDRRYRSPSPARHDFRRRNDSDRDELRRRDRSPYTRKQLSPGSHHRRNSSQTPPRRPQHRDRQRSDSPPAGRLNRRDVQSSDNNTSSRRKATPTTSEVPDALANRVKDQPSPRVQSLNPAKGSSENARRQSVSSTLPGDRKLSSRGTDSATMKPRLENSSPAAQRQSETARGHEANSSAGASEEVGTNS